MNSSECKWNAQKLRQATVGHMSSHALRIQVGPAIPGWSVLSVEGPQLSVQKSSPAKVKDLSLLPSVS